MSYYMKGLCLLLGAGWMNYMGMRRLEWIFQLIKMGYGGEYWKRGMGMVKRDGQSVRDLSNIEVSPAIVYHR
jgi:hypothetical protein